MKFKLIRYAYTLCLLSSSILFHTSCVNKEELQSEASIFFVPQSEKTFTRAFINGSEDINRFLVWGNYDGTPILNGTEVKKEGADWVYEPL